MADRIRVTVRRRCAWCTRSLGAVEWEMSRERYEQEVLAGGRFITDTICPACAAEYLDHGQPVHGGPRPAPTA